MRNTIRCCISCILPCGALDVIRIVHSNGRVEELTGPVKASDILKLYPKHVLKKPSSTSDDCCPKIIVVPPDADLQRGKIYFLMPLPPSSSQEKAARSKNRKKKKDERYSNNNNNNSGTASVAVCSGGGSSETDLLISDRYLTEILSEKVSTQRDRRRGRAAVWRPHLESICETPAEAP